MKSPLPNDIAFSITKSKFSALDYLEIGIDKVDDLSFMIQKFWPTRIKVYKHWSKSNDTKHILLEEIPTILRALKYVEEIEIDVEHPKELVKWKHLIFPNLKSMHL